MTSYYIPTGTAVSLTNCNISTSTNSTNGTWYTVGSGTTSGTSGTVSSTNISVYDDNKIVDGEATINPDSTLSLPDGSIIEVDSNGNFTIEDKDSKVIYKANRVREFNRYINASDLLEAFIEDLGKSGIKQGEVLSIPIEMFINWIIHKSAEQDGEVIPKDIPSLEDNRYKHPKCKYCGCFIKKEIFAKGLQFCDGDHYQKYLEK